MAAVRPYGDTMDDGRVQMSFTLPLAASERARQAAMVLASKMGLPHPQVVHMKPLGPSFSFFIVYGATSHAVDPTTLEVKERSFPLLAPHEINRAIRQRLKRPLVVVGACTGTDAHTVGLDAILSMKGFAGDKGLEYFTEMRVVNLGAQVAPDDVVAATQREKADAVLISQVVTQRDAHILHLVRVREALERAGERERIVLVGGGPRFSPSQAEEVGYDKIFGPGTKPSEVASYLVHTVTERQHIG